MFSRENTTFGQLNLGTMDNSLLDVLVIVGAVVITVISAIGKARKKAATKEADAGTDAESQNMPDTSGIPIPNPWQELLNLPEEEDDFIPKNPETAPLTPAPATPKKERQPLIVRDIEYEPRNYMEEMAKVKAEEREKMYSHSSFRNKHNAQELEVIRLDEEENDYTPLVDLAIHEEGTWKKAVIYHDLLEPKF